MINKIKPEYIKVMDNQENFFKCMYDMEKKHGFQWLAGYLATSQEIENQFMKYKSKNSTILRDIMNIAFHHSTDRLITRREHINLIIRAYEDYKHNGSWRKRLGILRKLIIASDNKTGIKTRKNLII